MKVSEFIEGYSDDTIYLLEMREALLTHPFKVAGPYFTSSFNRVHCIFMIGSLEAMLKEWSDKDSGNFLKEYFNKKNTNEVRIHNLFEAFHSNNIAVDLEILKDFLAIKYIRHSIMHSGWKENQMEYIKSRGFPIDSRELTDKDLEKMQLVNDKMMMYIAFTSFSELGINIEVENSPKTFESDFKQKSIIRQSEYPALLYNNLQRISDFISLRDETTQESTVNLKALAEEWIFFWEEYKKHSGLEEFISNINLDESINIICTIFTNKNSFKIPTPIGLLKKLNKELSNNTSEVPEHIILDLFNGILPFTVSSVLQSIIDGHYIYNIVPNNTPLQMCLNYLPTLIPERSEYLKGEAKLLIDLYKYSRYYYYFHEGISNDRDLRNTLNALEERINIGILK